MATVTLPKCDVFGTLSGVKTVTVEVIIPVDNDDDDCGLRAEIDLCRRAQERLLKFVRRGLAPPAKREKDSPDA